MIPVKQTLFGKDEGNCWPACIASITEIPIEEIPNFCVLYQYRWLEETSKWLKERGWDLYWFAVNKDAGHTLYRYIPEDVYYIGCGKSPRGTFQHVCIFQGDEMVHDPHPDNTGLDSEIKDWTFLVKRNV